MTIFVDGIPAALSRNMNFEYVSENRLFTDSDDYTLSLTFPLAGCARNLQIFGNINRADVHAGRVVFDCVIQDKALNKSGALVITEISESEVTAQFLGGRSALNYDSTLDDVYINELDLGSWPEGDTSIPVEDAWDPSSFPGQGVALPWVNDSSGNIQNSFVTNTDGSLSWHEDTLGLSWQPYLLDIAENIASALGYSADFSPWENDSSLKWLLVCNTLPWAWDVTEFARALPHWSVREFFSNLEPLLAAEFEFNHKEKSIVMLKLAAADRNAADATVIDNVVSEHNTEISAIEPETEYRGAKNIVFSDRDDKDWAYESCDWFIEKDKDKAIVFETISELNQFAKENRTWMPASDHRGSASARRKHSLLYVKDIDVYFVLRAVEKILTEERGPHLPDRYRYTLMPWPLNQLGGRVVDRSHEAPEMKLEVTPVRKDYTGLYTGETGNEADSDFGRMMFLNPADFGESAPEPEGPVLAQSIDDYIKNCNETFYQLGAATSLERGKEQERTEYYSVLYLGFWNGTRRRQFLNPLPVTGRYEPNDVLGVSRNPYSLNPADPQGPGAGIYFDVRKGVKTTFKFLADRVPDVRSLFVIRGKRYLCGKLSADFSHRGISRLMTGEFYPLADD